MNGNTNDKPWPKAAVFRNLHWQRLSGYTFALAFGGVMWFKVVKVFVGA
jgi:hypothetical protein